MKKVIAMLCASLFATGAFAQGFVGFANGATTTVRTNSGTVFWNPNGNDGISTGAAGGIAAGQFFNYGLFIRPGNVVSTETNVWDPSAGWTYTGTYATNTSAGRFSVGSTIVNGWAAGTTMEFIVAGWTMSLGGVDTNSVLNLLNRLNTPGFAFSTPGAFGVSVASFGAAAAAPPTPSFPLFGSTGATGSGLPIQSGFVLYSVNVPEPTTFAFAGLGAAALMILRRRK
jgi:hypothetical protein